MSYVHYQKDLILTSSAGGPWFTCTLSGAVAKWSPGGVNALVREIGVTVLTTIASPQAPVVTFWLTSQYPVTTTGNYTSLGTINLTTLGTTQGKEFYKAITPTEINPPAGIIVEVTTLASGAVLGEAHIVIEPSWEGHTQTTSGYVASA